MVRSAVRDWYGILAPGASNMSLINPNTVNPAALKRIAIVISNPAVSTTTGWPVGFWWSELAHPYHCFTEKGYEVEIFSPTAASARPAR